MRRAGIYLRNAELAVLDVIEDLVLGAVLRRDGEGRSVRKELVEDAAHRPDVCLRSALVLL